MLLLRFNMLPKYVFKVFMLFSFLGQLFIISFLVELAKDLFVDLGLMEEDGEDSVPLVRAQDCVFVDDEVFVLA